MTSDSDSIWQCDCRENLIIEYNFCPNCGRKINWLTDSDGAKKGIAYIDGKVTYRNRSDVIKEFSKK